MSAVVPADGIFPIRCGLYVRISSDRDDSELGVKRQEKECRDLVARKGWIVVEVYVDNDTSADKGVVRPAWLRMLEDARTGKLDAIVGWSLDRLTRQPREVEDLIDLNDAHGTQLGTVGGEIDLGTSMGQMCARMLVAYANAELKTRRVRQLSERAQFAADGKVNAGGRRPYGYLPDKITIDPAEAAHIQEATRRVLAGESLRGICADFTKRGIRGTTGAPFRLATLRKLLTSARISGRRELWQGPKGAPRPVLAPIVGDASWPEIISPEDNDALRVLLTQPHRATGVSNARKHLLPGFVYCAICERRMTSHKTSTGARGYTCSTDGPPKAGVDKCRRQIGAIGIEEAVVVRVLGRVQTPKFLRLLHERSGVDPAVVMQHATDCADRDEISRQKARGDLTPSEWQAQREVLTERIDAAETMIARQLQQDALLKLLDDNGTTIEERWSALSLDQRRTILRLVIERIVVSPGKPGQQSFDGRRVKVDWTA